MNDVYINRCYSYKGALTNDIVNIKAFEKYYLIVYKTPVSPIGYILYVYDNKHININKYELDINYFEFKICEDYFIYWTQNRMWISHIITNELCCLSHTEPIVDVCSINGTILFNTRKITNSSSSQDKWDKWNTSIYFELYKFCLDTKKTELLFLDYTSNPCVFDNIHDTNITMMKNIKTQNIEKLGDKLVILSWLGPSAIISVWNLNGERRTDNIPRLTVYRYELLVSTNRLYISTLNTDTIKIYTQYGKSILFNKDMTGPRINNILGLFQHSQHNYIVSIKGVDRSRNAIIRLTNRNQSIKHQTIYKIINNPVKTNKRNSAIQISIIKDFDSNIYCNHTENIYYIYDKLIIKTLDNKYIVYSLTDRKKLLIRYTTLFPGLNMQLIYNCIEFNRLK